MTELTGRVLYLGDPGWDQARYGFNARLMYDKPRDEDEPQVIVFCQCTQDVSNAIKWARERDVEIRARCGRHSYEGYSSLVKNGIIIDVNDMENVWLNRHKDEAVIESGINMLELVELLSDSGVTIPLAPCASVGLAGFTLGGGFGITSRKFGLACDNLLNVEMVDADGNIINANEHKNPDLFWACKGGGGGNFGIVTSFTFKLHPVNDVAAFLIVWSWDQFERVVDLWQDWAFNVEDGITSLLSLKVDRVNLIEKEGKVLYAARDEKTITLIGQFTPGEQESSQIDEITRNLLKPMLNGTTPDLVLIDKLSQVVAARRLFEVDTANPEWVVREHSRQQIFKSTSALANEFFDADAIRLLKERLEALPVLSKPPSQPCMIQLLGGGGAGSRVDSHATAVFNRKAKFILQYDGYWTALQDAEPIMTWVKDTRDALLRYSSDAYVNYHDEQIENPLRAYYGSNLERLVEVKKKYDPKNVFQYPQSIPIDL